MGAERGEAARGNPNAGDSEPLERKLLPASFSDAIDPSRPFFPESEVFLSKAELLEGRSILQFTWKVTSDTAPGFFRIYLPITLVPLLFRPKALLKKPVPRITSALFSAIRSSAFLSSFVGTFALSVLCLREVRQRDTLHNAAIGGFVCALSILIEKKRRRPDLVVYCIPKALEIMYKAMYRRGMVKYIKNAEVPMFAVAMAILVSYMYSRPGSVKGEGVFRFLLGKF